MPLLDPLFRLRNKHCTPKYCFSLRKSCGRLPGGKRKKRRDKGIAKAGRHHCRMTSRLFCVYMALRLPRAEWLTSPRSNITNNSPTHCVRLCSGNDSTPATLCLLPHSPGTLPRRLTGCGARIGRRPLGGTLPLRPLPLLQLPASAAGGGRLRSCSRPRWCTGCRGIPDYCNKKRALRFL